MQRREEKRRGDKTREEKRRGDNRRQDKRREEKGVMEGEECYEI